MERGLGGCTRVDSFLHYNRCRMEQMNKHYTICSILHLL